MTGDKYEKYFGDEYVEMEGETVICLSMPTCLHHPMI